MNAQIRRQIMERLKAERPEPESELNHNNAFELLIAVMLSAQATDKSVNLATPALFAAMPDAATMAQKTPEDVEPFIKTIGLYRNKAKHAVGIAKALMERFNGEVPQTLKELMSLPGVGEKTAKVVLNVAFHKPFIPVDTHIFRVCKPKRPTNAVKNSKNRCPRSSDWAHIIGFCCTDATAARHASLSARSARSPTCVIGLKKSFSEVAPRFSVFVWAVTRHGTHHA